MSQKSILYYIDKAECLNDAIHVVGWALCKNGTLPTYTLTNKSGAQVEFTFRDINRPDASRSVFGDERIKNGGFDIKFSYDEKAVYHLTLSDGAGGTTVLPLSAKNLRSSGFLSQITPKRMAKALKCLVKEGPQHLKERYENTPQQKAKRYKNWLEKQDVIIVEELTIHPLISIVVPMYRTPENFLRQMVESVQNQSYENWQLCLADGSEDGSCTELLKKLAAEDGRITYKVLKKNLGISGNTNEALALAKGDWIALLDHDDLLAKHALYEAVKVMEAHPETEVIYTDEDKVSMDLKTYFEPYAKSDFNLDLLRSNNYICHFFFAKKSLVDEIGPFRPMFDGAQDYDFILRCTEKAAGIYHIPKILYHWRCHQFSTAENPESKMYCYEAGRQAVLAHLERVGEPGEVILNREYLGCYHVKYPVQGEPLVSILIPNKDQKDTMDTCVKSILTKSTYTNYEIIIIENNSTEGETFAYYESLKHYPQVKVVTWDGEFNYAAINNFGATFAQGEYFILLNNDTEIISPDWIEGMLSNCQRKEVGITGAKLYYPDDTIQHAGVVMKLAGCCGHVFYGFGKNEPGKFARAILQQNYSAVTAACLMVKASVFREVGGLSEEFKVAYNDVDFCLKVRSLGYLVVFNPKVELYHYESKTRGYEDNEEKKARFLAEQERLKNRWPEYIEKGDPYYNPNLTLTAADYAFAMNQEQ